MKRYIHTGIEWKKRQVKDPFVKQRDQLGFNSRAAFKLLEMEQKYHFISSASTIVDLGAAPGGWSQVCLEKMKKPGCLVSIDLLPFQIENIQPKIQLHTLQADFLAPQTIETIYEKFLAPHGKKVDLILSDMMSNTTGNTGLDCGRSIALCNQVLLFYDYLVQYDLVDANTKVIMKYFAGEDELEFKSKVKSDYFKNLKVIKPDSSRKESKEAYFVCFN